MKKNLSIVCVFVLLLALVACSPEEVSTKEEISSSNEDLNEEENDKVEEVSNEEMNESEKEEVLNEETNESEEEVDEEGVEEAGEVAEVKEKDSFHLDSSLVDMELLSSITYTMPDSYISVTESVSADGNVGTVKTYSKGMFLRTESKDAAGELQVGIYNPDLGINWMYSEGQGFGMVSYDEDDDEEDVDVFNVEGATYADLFSEEMGSVEAKVDVLDGKEMIFIKMAQDDGMGGIMDIHMWYLPEYGIVMKYDMYRDDVLIITSNVTEYEADVDLDASLFEEPEGIEFMEF